MLDNLKLNGDGTAEFSSCADDFLAAVKNDAQKAVKELVEIADMKAGEIFVVGCSSSEVCGTHIGKGSILPVAEAIFDAIMPILKEKGIFLAAQCCEHLNRAMIVERSCTEKYGYEPVCVRPVAKAGGSFATTAYERFDAPCAIEYVRAHAGIDIGGTLIGMHLREVAVPVRLSVKKIGEANILCARTRPKYIGGPRANY